MIIRILLNYLSGYVSIKVESYYIERFINICTRKKIFLWNIKRKKSTILYANVSIKEYKKIRDVAKKSQSKVRIEKKKGIPIILYKYRKRRIFLFLLILILIGFISLSQFIWNIEIIGTETIKTEEILKDIEEAGLTTGKLKSKIDTEDIINNIRLNRNDLAWVGITIKGTNAMVKVAEKKEKPEIIDENNYCNIVSDKEAMIIKINVQNGTALVKEGDIVKKGTILVGGYLEGKYTGMRYVHGLATIKGKVWYSKKEKALLKQQIQVASGNTETKYSIKINNFTINFYKTLSKFQNYDTIRKSKKISIFSNFYLPIEIIKTTNSEYYKEDKEYTEEELTTQIKEKLEKEILNEIKNKESITNEQTNVYKYNDAIEVEVIYEALEDIGTEEKIVF